MKILSLFFRRTAVTIFLLTFTFISCKDNGNVYEVNNEVVSEKISVSGLAIKLSTDENLVAIVDEIALINQAFAEKEVTMKLQSQEEIQLLIKNCKTEQ